jgi:hypothetical protein
MTSGKREWIGRHGKFRYLSIETSEVDVRRYGEAAIVRCVQRSRASWCGEPMALAAAFRVPVSARLHDLAYQGRTPDRSRRMPACAPSASSRPSMRTSASPS